MTYTTWDEMLKAAVDIECITGMTLPELRNKFAAGYTLQAPKVKYGLCPEHESDLELLPR